MDMYRIKVLILWIQVYAMMFYFWWFKRVLFFAKQIMDSKFALLNSVNFLNGGVSYILSPEEVCSNILFFII